MARELMLLVAMAIVCMAPGIRGQAHSFATDSQVNEISRTGCGETKLCIASPAACDPKDGNCMFTSVVINKNTGTPSLDVALAGQSTGFIAMGFTEKPAEKVMLFVCGQNSAENGAPFFKTMISDMGDLTPLEMSVNEIRGSVDGDMIKCEFNVPREGDMMDNKIHIILGSGTAEGKNLGTFITALVSGLLDVTDPTSA